MTVRFNFVSWGSSPSMTCGLCKWEYKAIDMKSILIQERVGFFPPFVTDTYQAVTTWQSEAVELPNARLWGSRRDAPEWAPAVSFGPRLCCVLSSVPRLNVRFVFLLFIKSSHCSCFRDLEKLAWTSQLFHLKICWATAWFGQRLSRWVGSGLVLICFGLGGSEGIEKYSWWVFLLVFFK